MYKMLTAAAVMAALAAPIQAKWTAKPSSFLMREAASESFELYFEMPEMGVVVEDGYTHLTVPGHVHSLKKGMPELPVVTTSIQLPHRGTPKASLEVLEETTIQLEAPVVPSHGPVTRDIPLSSLPRVEGPVYSSGAAYPAEGFAVELDSPYVLRDVRGAAVRVSPVVYDPANQTLKVATKFKVHVEVTAGAVGINEVTPKRGGISADFANLYRDLFINSELAGFAEGELDETVGRSIILVPDQWVANIQPLVEWRQKKGLETKVIPMSEVGEGTAAIQAKITAEYEAGGMTYVLLVGDSDTMPTLKGENEGADCDACYVKLAGDDHVPDAFISRFSAQSAADVDVQVARAISYEKEPVLDGAFYRKATGIASDEGQPKDYDRMDILKVALEGYHSDLVDQVYDRGYGKKATPDQVVTAVNDGRSLINYMGHGSKTAWMTSRFGVSHIKNQLTNDDGQWPMIWSVACVNGDFVGGSDSFGEAWAKAGTAEAPKGAIGVVAASTNMAWHPPVDWQAAVIKDFMIAEKVFTGGAQHHYGLVKAMEKWGTSASSDGVQMVEQCIYFGDASVVLRNDTPKVAEVTKVSAEGDELVIEVKVDGNPWKASRIVVTAGEVSAVATTGANGTATLPSALLQGPITVTVTGPNLVPVLDQPLL